MFVFTKSQTNFRTHRRKFVFALEITLNVWYNAVNDKGISVTSVCEVVTIMGNKIGIRIRELRKRAGMTQAELAARIGVSASTVGMYEQGRREPDNTKLVELCNVFGVSVDHLLGNSGAEDNSGSVEVSEVFDEFTKKLSAQEGLMFDGVPLNNSDRMKIIDAIKVVAAIARQQHKSALGEE